MSAAQLYGSPLDLEAHGAGIIVQLGNVRKDLRVDLGANRFCKMFRELWIFHLAGEGGFHTKSRAFIELYKLVSNSTPMQFRYVRRSYF